MNPRRFPPPPPGAPPAARPLRERLQSTLFEPAPAVPAVPPEAPRAEAARTPISITELTDRIGRQLGLSFPSVCVMGEVSKVVVAANGHTYFTLKDAGSTLDAILWASNREAVAAQPRLGERVVATGAVRVFAPQGRYALHVDTLDLVGVGDLQRALEALKARLRAEGLFADARKRALPKIVRTVAVVTSPTGAVRQDIEQTLSRGGARVRVLISPTRVQGEGAGAEIAEAIRLVGERGDVDVIIVARGGGSIEDLWPFNEEVVARALVACGPPVISAVGHETDFTVSDFVADVRAATPSVAASMVVDIQRRAAERAANASVALARAIERCRDRWRLRFDRVSTHRVVERERTKLERLRSRLTSTFTRARVAVERQQARRLSVFRDLTTRCEAQAPRQIFGRAHGRVDRALLLMGTLIAAQVALRRSRFGGVVAGLDALSPLAVLSRGYALATTPEGRILMNARDVATGDPVVVRLSRGRLIATVTDRDEEVS